MNGLMTKCIWERRRCKIFNERNRWQVWKTMDN